MLVKVRHIDWPMLATALKSEGYCQYSIVGTFDGWVFVRVQWNTLKQLNRFAKEQRAKMCFDLAA
jgi:hypothetical protein